VRRFLAGIGVLALCGTANAELCARVDPQFTPPEPRDGAGVKTRDVCRASETPLGLAWVDAYGFEVGAYMDGKLVIHDAVGRSLAVSVGDDGMITRPAYPPLAYYAAADCVGQPLVFGADPVRLMEGFGLAGHPGILHPPPLAFTDYTSVQSRVIDGICTNGAEIQRVAPPIERAFGVLEPLRVR